MIINYVRSLVVLLIIIISYISFIYHFYIKFVEMGIFGTNRRVENHIWNAEGRIQDKEYLEMFDQGLCLSMHQPYASLLVTGIKT